MPPLPKTDRVPPAGQARRARARRWLLTITLLDPERADAAPPERAPRRAGPARPRRTATPIRLLARFENEGPRRVGIEVRGEDASDLLPLLKGRRVIVEPQMMELRFGDEPLRPRFDLELSQDGDADRRARRRSSARAIRASSRRRAGRVVRGEPGLVRRRAGGLGAADRPPRVARARSGASCACRSSTSRSSTLPQLVLQGLPEGGARGRRRAARALAGRRRRRPRADVPRRARAARSSRRRSACAPPTRTSRSTCAPTG